MTSTRTRLAGLALLVLAILSGCGALHPGIAVEVGDHELTDSEVDNLAQDLCDVLESDPAFLQGTLFARSAIKQSVVSNFVLRTVADQLADEYDVTVADDYAMAAEQVRAQFPKADPDAVDRIMPSFIGEFYFDRVATEVGRKELKASGAAQSTDDEALAKGLEIAKSWEAKHGGFTINPEFSRVSISDDVSAHLIYSPEETAYAVSSYAKRAAAEMAKQDVRAVDPAWVESLPPSQTCG